MKLYFVAPKADRLSSGNHAKELLSVEFLALLVLLALLIGFIVVDVSALVDLLPEGRIVLCR